MQSHQLCTLITFVWLNILHHILGKVLDLYKYHLSKVCSKTAQPQKSQFFKNTPNRMTETDTNLLSNGVYEYYM
jgi:hypothetical protein